MFGIGVGVDWEIELDRERGEVSWATGFWELASLCASVGDGRVWADVGAEADACWAGACGPSREAIPPEARDEVGLSTARVTIDAKLGPEGTDAVLLGWVWAAPGRGGKAGADSVVGDDCLSAMTEGGGWKFGVGLGRTFGR